ncbi:hypothetical protein JW887_02010 [Candidatus Dojkabacteria bacterium]|nr:hypothetical protein [Candidatus Dojkabacteria bacterium]
MVVKKKRNILVILLISLAILFSFFPPIWVILFNLNLWDFLFNPILPSKTIVDKSYNNDSHDYLLFPETCRNQYKIDEVTYEIFDSDGSSMYKEDFQTNCSDRLY